MEDFLPLSLNALLKMHWTARDKRLTFDKGLVVAAVTNSRGVPRATGRREVGLLFLAPRWELLPDGDNAKKAIADALTQTGMLLDDKFQCCRWGVVDGRADPHLSRPQTVIYLTDIGPVLE